MSRARLPVLTQSGAVACLSTSSPCKWARISKRDRPPAVYGLHPKTQRPECSPGRECRSQLGFLGFACSCMQTLDGPAPSEGETIALRRFFSACTSRLADRTVATSKLRRVFRPIPPCTAPCAVSGCRFRVSGENQAGSANRGAHHLRPAGPHVAQRHHLHHYGDQIAVKRLRRPVRIQPANDRPGQVVAWLAFLRTPHKTRADTVPSPPPFPENRFQRPASAKPGAGSTTLRVSTSPCAPTVRYSSIRCRRRRRLNSDKPILQAQNVISRDWYDRSLKWDVHSPKPRKWAPPDDWGKCWCPGRRQGLERGWAHQELWRTEGC